MSVLKKDLLDNLGGRMHIIKVHPTTCSKCGKVHAEELDKTRLPIMYSSIEYLDDILCVSPLFKYTSKNNLVSVQVTVSSNTVVCERCLAKIAKLLKKTK